MKALQVHAEWHLVDPLKAFACQLAGQGFRGDGRGAEQAVQASEIAPGERGRRSGRGTRAPSTDDAWQMSVEEPHHRRIEITVRAPGNPGAKERTADFDDAGTLVVQNPVSGPGREQKAIRLLSRNPGTP